MSNDCKCCGDVVIVGEEVTVPAVNCIICDEIICQACVDTLNECTQCSGCGEIVCNDCYSNGLCFLCIEREESEAENG